MSDEADRLSAGALALGLMLGSIPREAVIAWADREIAAREAPEAWLLDLSLSIEGHVADLTSLLRRAGAGSDPEQVFRTSLWLVHVRADLTFEEAEDLAARLYGAAGVCFANDWSRQLLSEVDQLHDTFCLVRDRLIGMTPDEAIAEVRQFVERNRSAHLPESLRTVGLRP